MPNPRLLAAASIVVLVAACCAFTIASPGNALVVYCAHDSIYSAQLLEKFESQTGIEVAVRFDTEGTKSLGLVNLLLQEKENPRCDVFWNNELLGTLDLQEAGVLEPYKGPGHQRIPDRYRDPDGHWTGFGGRLRVGIFNTDRIPAKDRDLTELSSKSLNRMAIAKPLYGTTRTHITALWHQNGAERFKSSYRDLLEQGVLEVQGNSMVKNLVAAGTRDFGWTDTDDYYVAVDQKQPVAIAPVRLDGGETICIPNTVAIIKGSTRTAEAKKLVEFLLSAETELALSQSKSRQIPLGDCDETQLSEEVKQLREWAESSCDLREIAASRKACLHWLKSEYLQ